MARNTQGMSTHQVQAQTQTLSPIQVMVARLMELPVDALRERIDKELDENRWLEAEYKGNGESRSASSNDSRSNDSDSASEDNESHGQHDETNDQFDDDYLPTANNGNEERKGGEQANPEDSFLDHLMAQVGEFNLTEHQQEILTYLIGSLDDDGLLHTPLLQIMDEMEIYRGISTNQQEVEAILQILQSMEPAGVGARSLQECLTLQAKHNYTGDTREQLLKLFQTYWDDFSHMRWNKIQKVLKLDDVELDNLIKRIRKFNPRPGGSMSNGGHTESHTITPDLRVDRDETGTLHLSLCEGDLPRLTVSPDADIALSQPMLTKQDREAMRYLRDRVDSATLFIKALEQRRHSMLVTMKAIIKLQRPFFLDGDETRLRPMKLEDVSQLTGLDISTTSRVCTSKYVQTEYGTYPLRWFFTAGTVQDGESVTILKILDELKNLVQNEDTSHPLSDDKLAAELHKRGYEVARRTVAKYRIQLNIPESRLRKR